MFQHMRLYELPASTKALLTGFILVVCAAGAVGSAAFYYACRDADGESAISFDDIRIFLCGAGRSILEEAAADPGDVGLNNATTDDLRTLVEWCEAGAPRSGFAEIRRILKASKFDRTGKGAFEKVLADADARRRRYQRVAQLARRRERLSAAEVATGVALYLAVVALALLGLGMMFVHTSLFEKTKVFVVSATVVVAVAFPVSFALARRHPGYLYPTLLSALLMAVCFGVMALVALYDLWFRRPVT